LEKLAPGSKVFTFSRYLPFPSGQSRTAKVGKNGATTTVLVDPGVEGYVFAKYSIVNLRMDCFYVDWDEKEGGWKYPLLLKNIEELRKALTIFKGKLDDYVMVALLE